MDKNPIPLLPPIPGGQIRYLPSPDATELDETPARADPKGGDGGGPKLTPGEARQSSALSLYLYRVVLGD